MSTMPVSPDWDADDDMATDEADIIEGEAIEVSPSIDDDAPAVLPKHVYVCTGIKAKSLTRVQEPHPLPLDSSPNGGTTDSSGRFMRGWCLDCHAVTIWKGATL